MGESKVKQERKFHDAWAFYLFIVYTIVMNTMFILNSENPASELQTLESSNKIVECFLSNLAFVLILLLTMLLLCYLLPEFLIILSVVAVPIISVVLFLQSGVAEGSSGNFIGTLLFLFNFFFIIIACITVLSNLTYIAAGLKTGSLIFFCNIFSITFLQICCLCILVMSFIPAALANADTPIIKALRVLEFFLAAWTIFILKYSMEVYISSVVFFQIQSNTSDIFINSLGNSLYALGSICFGALLVAVITTINFLLSSARNNNNGERRGIFTIIMMSIAEAFVDLLGQIVKFANNLAYPYLSINGTSYYDSVSQSYQEMTSNGVAKMASYVGLSFVISTVSIFSSLVIYVFNTRFLLEKLSVSADKTIYGVILTFVFSSFFYIVFSLLQSVVLALIYASVTCRDQLQNYDPVFSKILEEEKRKTNA